MKHSISLFAILLTNSVFAQSSAEKIKLKACYEQVVAEAHDQVENDVKILPKFGDNSVGGTYPKCTDVNDTQLKLDDLIMAGLRKNCISIPLDPTQTFLDQKLSPVLGSYFVWNEPHTQIVIIPNKSKAEFDKILATYNCEECARTARQLKDLKILIDAYQVSDVGLDKNTILSVFNESKKSGTPSEYKG